MRVWIDMSNSPHPLLFAPIERRLSERGAEVLITVRDHAQTLQLARERWPAATVLGTAAPPGRGRKATAIAGRVGECLRWARRTRPDVALSHNSYAQLLAARLGGIPAVTAMDYEHQPANHLAFRAAHRILVPEALPADHIRRQGAAPAKLTRYPGLKEELYLSDFEPDPTILGTLGIERGPRTAVVVARSAPAGAAYHPRENPLFVEGLRVLSRQPEVRVVALARHEAQRSEIESMNLPNCTVSSRALDGRSLLCASDLFVGAGGTMSREAALLGVPALSMFAGHPPAVDEWLRRRGMLRTFERLEQLEAVEPRADRSADLERLRAAAEPIEQAFLGAVEATAAGL